MIRVTLFALSFFATIYTTTAIGKGGASAAERKKSTIGITGIYAGIADAALSAGAAAYVLLSEDVTVGVGLLQGSEDLTASIPASGMIVADKVTVASQFTYGYGRFFLGNSFNVMAGLGMMSGEIVMNVRDDVSNFRLDTTLSLSGMVVPLAIGNHWRFGPVVFGIDYFQGFYFLSGESKASVSASDTTTDSLQEFSDDLAKLGDTLVDGTLLALGVISLGIEF